MTPCLWLVNRPKPYLMAFIYAFVVSGVYAIEASLFHVGVALGFGLLGYAMRYFGVPFLPMVLGVVLGFMVESNYRRALGALQWRLPHLPAGSDFRRRFWGWPSSSSSARCCVSTAERRSKRRPAAGNA